MERHGTASLEGPPYAALVVAPVSDGEGWLLAFDRDDPAFVLGVEVGILWQRLHDEPHPVEAVVHAANAEMVLRLAEATDTTAVADEAVDGDWLSVSFS